MLTPSGIAPVGVHPVVRSVTRTPPALSASWTICSRLAIVRSCQPCHSNPPLFAAPRTRSFESACRDRPAALMARPFAACSMLSICFSVKVPSCNCHCILPHSTAFRRYHCEVGRRAKDLMRATDRRTIVRICFNLSISTTSLAIGDHCIPRYLTPSVRPTIPTVLLTFVVRPRTKYSSRSYILGMQPLPLTHL